MPGPTLKEVLDSWGARFTKGTSTAKYNKYDMTDNVNKAVAKLSTH